MWLANSDSGERRATDASDFGFAMSCAACVCALLLLHLLVQHTRILYCARVAVRLCFVFGLPSCVRALFVCLSASCLSRKPTHQLCETTHNQTVPIAHHFDVWIAAAYRRFPAAYVSVVADVTLDAADDAAGVRRALAERSGESSAASAGSASDVGADVGGVTRKKSKRAEAAAFTVALAVDGTERQFEEARADAVARGWKAKLCKRPERARAAYSSTQLTSLPRESSSEAASDRYFVATICLISVFVSISNSI